MALPADLSRLTARDLRTALIIASRNQNASERARIMREYARRGISPNIRKRKG